MTYPNGIVATYGYDAAGRLTSLTYTSGQTTIGDLTYSYDLAGQQTAVGGSLARTGLPAATSATYDAGNRLANWNGTTVTHDFNGNLAGDGTSTHAWNTRDQLSSLAGGASASFAYDGMGRRRAKTVGGSTTRFLYDELTLVQELTNGGTPTANLLTGMRLDETFTRTDGNGTAPSSSTPSVAQSRSVITRARCRRTTHSNRMARRARPGRRTGIRSTTGLRTAGRTLSLPGTLLTLTEGVL